MFDVFFSLDIRFVCANSHSLLIAYNVTFFRRCKAFDKCIRILFKYFLIQIFGIFFIIIFYAEHLFIRIRNLNTK